MNGEKRKVTMLQLVGRERLEELRQKAIEIAVKLKSEDCSDLDILSIGLMIRKAGEMSLDKKGIELKDESTLSGHSDNGDD